jgi:hypothetical protein
MHWSLSGRSAFRCIYVHIRWKFISSWHTWSTDKTSLKTDVTQRNCINPSPYCTWIRRRNNVSTINKMWAGVRGFDSRQGLRIFLFTTASRTALAPTQPPIQWVLGALSLGESGRGVKLTTHLHLVPRSKNAWSYTSAPPIRFRGVVLSWKKAKRQLYFLPFTINKIKTQDGLIRCITITVLFSCWIIYTT